MYSRETVMRINKMMTYRENTLIFYKFSQLILTGNEWRSVWRICKWMLGLKERIRNFKDRLLRLQTLRLKLALSRFFTYLYFILVQILDLSFRVFCLLAEKKRLLKQKNMTLFAFSSELLWVKNGKRVLKESICFNFLTCRLILSRSTYSREGGGGGGISFKVQTYRLGGTDMFAPRKNLTFFHLSFPPKVLLAIDFTLFRSLASLQNL